MLSHFILCYFSSSSSTSIIIIIIIITIIIIIMLSYIILCYFKMQCRELELTLTLPYVVLSVCKKIRHQSIKLLNTIGGGSKELGRRE